MSSIAEIQDQKERDILQKYEAPDGSPADEAALRQRQDEAARVLQRTFRGHRERRQLKGLSLDPSSRWTEAIKEAQYRALITPRSRHGTDGIKPVSRTGSAAQDSWARVGKIARRATMDEDSSLSSDSDSSLEYPSPGRRNRPLTPSQKEVRRQKKLAAKQESVKSAKTMDLSYFLELVDVKHRYGSNLRKYHAEWRARPTHENFFYWLDHGEGKDLELPNCSRQRLESMQVRYLSKEERRSYEVVVGENGKLQWRKDDVKVDTTDGMWKDSVVGIVKADSKERAWAHDRPIFARGSSESSGLDSGIDEGPTSTKGQTGNNTEEQAPSKKADEPTKQRRSFKDLFRRPSDQKTPKTKPAPPEKKKKQIWIFVADTKNNLYIGLKQSGAFQHSSFLHGSRISAAGLIKVKDGQLRILQPRSGHYRTPSHNLHIFIKSLQARGVDMSVTAVGGSYAAAVGIEAYMKTKGKINRVKEGLKHMTIPEQQADEQQQTEEERKKEQAEIKEALVRKKKHET